MNRVLRWLSVVLGGVSLGIGLFAHAEIALARALRAEVQDTFFLWRAIGKLTFFMQNDVRRLALSLDQVPEPVLVASDRVAWVFVVGGIALALFGPLLLRKNPALSASGRAGPRAP